MLVSFLPIGLTLLLTIPGAVPINAPQVGSAPELERNRQQRPFRLRRATPNELRADDRPVFRVQPAAQASATEAIVVENRAPQVVTALNRKSVVVRLKHAPAADMSELVQNWLKKMQPHSDQPVADVVPDVLSNSLLIRGTNQQLEEIDSILSELDKPRPQIRLRTLLAEVARTEAPQDGAGSTTYQVSDADLGQVIAELRQRGELHNLARPELLVLDNQPASLQLGHRVPRIVGTGSTRGGTINNVELENVGTLIGVTCRVADEGSVTMEIDLERSHLGQDAEGTPLSVGPEGNEVRTPVVHTLTLQTTVTLKNGQNVLIGGMVYQTEHGWREMVLLVCPEILP